MPTNRRARRRLGLALLAVSAAVGGLGAAPLEHAAADTPAQASADAIGRPEEPVPGRYIVTLAERVEPVDVEDTARDLAAEHRGTVVDVYEHALNGFTATMSEAEARELLADPSVERVDQDGIVRVATTQTPAPWGLDRIDERDRPLDSAYTYNSAGAGVHVYVIDTGIRVTHTQFGGRASIGIDTIGDGWAGNDCHGHGTHVAGIAAGATYGVAKSAAIVSVRTLNCQGTGTISQVIAGVDWVTANAVKPAVANMSLGGDGASVPLDAAVANSITSGIPYAVAAGNDGVDACSFSPSRVATALTVSATDQVDERPNWANYGSCVKLFAPGTNIQSAGRTSDTVTVFANGTSMATPFVAGTAARYLSEHPDATTNQVFSPLTSEATIGRVTNPGPGSPNRLDYSNRRDTTHPGTMIAAAGSASTEQVTKALIGADPLHSSYDENNFNVGAFQASPFLVAGDAACGDVTYSSGGSGSTPPAGPDAGRDALRDSVGATYPTAALGAGGGCIDIARTELEPRPVGAGGDRATFEYFAYGLDAITWASPSLQAPQVMTLQQLRDIYDCVVTEWSALPGGGHGPIVRALPPPGTGTRRAFVTHVLGKPDTPANPWSPPTTASCPAPVEFAENDAQSLHNAIDRVSYQTYILPYSGAAWIRQANNSVNPTLDRRNGVRPGGLVRTADEPIDPGLATWAVRWAGTEWRLNNASVVNGRTVANITSSVGSISLTSQAGAFGPNDVGKTVEGTAVYPATTITAVSPDGSTATIAPGAREAGAFTAKVGPAAVSEHNPNALTPSDTSVFPGALMLSSVVDTSAPSYPTARDLVGFVDAPAGFRSPTCSGTAASTIASAGFLALAARSTPGGNVSTCRRITP